MFTGIIEAIGEITNQQTIDGDQRLQIKTDPEFVATVKLGDSIAVNGVCLTVVEATRFEFFVDVSNETLDCTALGDYAVGRSVNLERALQLSDRLDGHLVSGHVDATATVVQIEQDARSRRIDIECDESLMRYIVKKGSICIDGVSLTVNSVEGNRLSVNIVPHTLEKTILSDYKKESRVNVEIDIIARYIEKMLPEQN